MSEKVEYRGGGIGFCGVLGIVFITLQICGVINWPWLWVLAPIWIPLALAGVLIVFGVAIMALAAMMFSIGDRQSEAVRRRLRESA